MLEGLCFWMIVQNNRYHSAWFFNSSNAVSGNVNNFYNDFRGYFQLQETNRELAAENAQLRKEIARLATMANLHTLSDTIIFDSTQYLFNEAQVVGKTTRQLLNFITIDKGKNDGIRPDMGLVGPNGIVGQIKDVSNNYATAYSLLHINLLTSGYISSTSTFCTVQWDGRDPLYSKILYVPRHVAVSPGDSVLTSGYNAIYPPDLLIGTISAVDISDDATFLDITMKLATDFNNLDYVYYINNLGKIEKDSLEQNSIPVN